MSRIGNHISWEASSQTMYVLADQTTLSPEYLDQYKQENPTEDVSDFPFSQAELAQIQSGLSFNLTASGIREKGFYDPVRMVNAAPFTPIDITLEVTEGDAEVQSIGCIRIENNGNWFLEEDAAKFFIDALLALISADNGNLQFPYVG